MAIRTPLLVFLSVTFCDVIHAAETAASYPYSELSRKTINLHDHKITLIKVRPPALPKAPKITPTLPRELTKEEQAAAEQWVKKEYANLSVSATVYLDGNQPVTELRWRDDTGTLSFVAYSNVDFRYLTQLSSLETDTTVYSWFPFVDECHLKDWPSNLKYPIPQGLTFSATEAEYFVDAQAKTLKDQETTLAGLDYLHAYYQINHAKLKADFENPPKPADINLRWWPLKS
jgi:hypothetical protein